MAILFNLNLPKISVSNLNLRIGIYETGQNFDYCGYINGRESNTLDPGFSAGTGEYVYQKSIRNYCQIVNKNEIIQMKIEKVSNENEFFFSYSVFNSDGSLKNHCGFPSG